MQPRTLEQIYSALDSVYTPQVNSLRTRQANTVQEAEADVAAATGAKDRAFGDIMSGARRRGTGIAFGGIPLAEQARYASDVFAPSVMKAKADARNRATSLEEAILGLNERRTTQAQGIFDGERNFFEQQRQYNESQALQREQMAAQQRQAAAAQWAPTMGMPGGQVQGVATQKPATAAVGSYGFKNKKDGSAGFWFTDAQGNAISAARYAQLAGTNAVTLFQKMAAAGDKGAAQALQSLRGPGFDQGARQKYNSLFWGVG